MKLYKTLLTLVLLLMSFGIFSQNTRKISGQVTDTNGEPLIGVSIQLKGSTLGSMTDFDGNYSIYIPEGNNQILVFSYLGFKPKDVAIDSRAVINVVLEDDVQMLDEVVMVAYGAVAKRSVTGSVSVVAGRDVTANDKKKSAGTWKRSGMPDNSIRLEVGDNDFIPLEAAQMAVQIDGFRVRVLIDCFFYNSKGSGLEGMFKLNLPTGASPYFFAFGETEYINEDDEDEDEPTSKKKTKLKQIPFVKYDYEDFDLSYDKIDDSDFRDWNRVKEARIVSKQKAAKAYEQTVSRKVDPALMEWGGADMFTCKVFPLSNNTLHQVVIGYELNMIEALDFREYVLTLPKTETDLKLDVSIYTSKIHTPAIKPKVTGAKTENNRLQFSVLNPKVKEYVIQYDNVEPVLLQKAEESSSDIPYFAANYRINLPEVKQDNLPSDAIFMLDLSLSSNPDKFNVWLKLMEEILDKNRDVIKRFAVLCFNVDNYWYAPYYQRNNYYNMTQLLDYANTLALEGATNLATALQEASNPSWLKDNKPKHIFMMSDADCNWGETNMHTFKHLVNEGDRIHTYKSGLSGTNATILDYLSRTTGGFSFTVTGEEEAALTAKSFRYKPWFIEKVQMEGVDDFLISGQPVILYNGQKLIFTGRGAPSGKVLIKVNNGQESKELYFSAKEKIESNLAGRIYGQIAMNYLENYGYKAEDASVNYSTYYRIPGQYTSFLMLESESDYDDFGIDTSDAEDFVEENLVSKIIEELEAKNAGALLGNGKADFLRWLEHLKSDKSTISFDPDSTFMEYISNLPEELFKIRLVSNKFRLRLAADQTEEEAEMLAGEDLRFDNMLTLAKKRRKNFSNEDGLKLLSSVVERNAGDLTAIRDIAMTAIDWGMGDQAFYLMRRIIDWREGEALAYQMAADALASLGNNIDMAIVYYYICLHSDWDSDYGSFQSITALQCLRYIESIVNDPGVYITDSTRSYLTTFTEQVKEILEDDDLLISESDIVIMVNWNIDNTDIDLHVIEPTGEECYYSNKNTKIGGRLTYDVTSGYGPEMYVLRKAVDGLYKIHLDYYSDSDTKTASRAKAYIDIYRDWGRKTEKRTRKTVYLEKENDKIDVMSFYIGEQPSVLKDKKTK